LPELPEVETTRRGIAPYVLGQYVDRLVVREHRLRWPVPADLPARLAGACIAELRRRGKYLLFRIEPAAGGHEPAPTDEGPGPSNSSGERPAGTLLIHLGMSGSLRVVDPAAAARKHDHVDLVLQSGLCLRFHDPRRFGCMLWIEGTPEAHPLLAELGPEPLEPGFGGRHLHGLSRNRSAPVKAFIMDSHVVVGVGNIYANESLFRAGISPGRAAGRISLSRYERLAESIRDVLAASIAQGGTTLRDFVNEAGNPGYFRQTLQVYERAGEPCRRCGTEISLSRLGQRATYWCPKCQR
jgi:formamidopyrimidine-DNA glycosylase